jgi:hypothetical protein
MWLYSSHCTGVTKVILNWLRPLWEGDQEVAKRSGRDEPLWVAIHVHGSNARNLSV